MIVTKHTKKRNMSREKIQPIARFPNNGTSFILLIFYVLIYPILYVHTMESRSESMLREINFFYIDVVSANYVANSIGSVMYTFDVRLNVTSYRRWQRALIKVKKIASFMMLANILEEQNDDNDSQNNAEELNSIFSTASNLYSYNSAILQAGHTFSTAISAYAGPVKGVTFYLIQESEIADV